MTPAADRTLPMFPGIEPTPTKQQPTFRTLRMRTWKAALARYKHEISEDEFWDVVGELAEALERKVRAEQ